MNKTSWCWTLFLNISEVDAVTALINHRADVNAASGACWNCLQQTFFRWFMSFRFVHEFNLPHFSRMICRYLQHQLSCAGAEPPETPLDIAKGLLDATDRGAVCLYRHVYKKLELDGTGRANLLQTGCHALGGCQSMLWGWRCFRKNSQTIFGAR